MYLAIVLFGILKCFAAHPIDFQPHLGRRMKYGKHLLYLLNIYYIPDTGLNALHSLIYLIITVILWGTYYYRWVNKGRLPQDITKSVGDGESSQMQAAKLQTYS